MDETSQKPTYVGSHGSPLGSGQGREEILRQSSQRALEDGCCQACRPGANDSATWDVSLRLPVEPNVILRGTCRQVPRRLRKPVTSRVGTEPCTDVASSSARNPELGTRRRFRRRRATRSPRRQTDAGRPRRNELPSVKTRGGSADGQRSVGEANLNRSEAAALPLVQSSSLNLSWSDKVLN